MKILSISSGYYPAFEVGGIASSVHGLNKALVKAGHTVTNVASNQFLEKKLDAGKEYDFDGVKCYYFSFVKRLEFITTHGWQFSISLMIFLLQNIKKYDIVHIHSTFTFPSFIASVICWINNKPYVFTPRGMLNPVAISNKIKIKSLYLKIFTHFEINNAAAIHFTTVDEQNNAFAHVNKAKKQCVIPNGIDLSEYESLVKECKQKRIADKKIILYLGRISWIKGFDVLIKAIKMYKEKRSDVQLIVAGQDEGGYLQTVKQFIVDNDLQWTDNLDASDFDVLFTGMVVGIEKIKLYKTADIFVLPSYSENFANTVLEAGLCKLPMVLSNKVGVSSEFINAAEIVEPTAGNLHEAFENLLNNNEYREKIALNAYEIVIKKFTWSRIAKSMSDLYMPITEKK
jgi:glycosyltransferase involved in cell wall biosynthesis